MGNEDKLDVVRKFMASEFPGFSIDTHEQSDRYRYELRRDDSHHVILVLREFLDAFQAHEIEMQLTNYNVALIASSLSDVPILVTTSGCIVEREFSPIFCSPR